jgi:kynureninase
MLNLENNTLKGQHTDSYFVSVSGTLSRNKTLVTCVCSTKKKSVVMFGQTLFKSDCQYMTNQRKITEFLASCTLLMSPRQYR